MNVQVPKVRDERAVAGEREELGWEVVVAVVLGVVWEMDLDGGGGEEEKGRRSLGRGEVPQ